MKSEFQAKFLQHMVQKKKQNEGFTLIELLVVIIIIGILAAIALPSFLNQANKAKESESKQYVGSMNRTQQAYFLEANVFTTDVSRLGLGIKTASTNYTYGISAAGDNKTAITNVSYPLNTTTLRAHTGGVQTALTGGSEATTIAILCQSVKPQAGNPNGVDLASATTAGAQPSCQATTWETLDK
jgi:prepilin-type N-terminal cleavage/methylation domain-containing protein